ncbi:MAG: DUF2490 domain-containing protein [Bacteroidota bacterium]
MNIIALQRYIRILFFTLVLSLVNITAFSQTEKTISRNSHFWISANNIYQLTNRWGILNDIHIRRTDFVQNPSFYFVRGGLQYSIKRNLRVAGGYAHLWLASPTQRWESYLNENRTYQQISFSQRYPRLNTLFRVRNEQRIFNTVVNGTSQSDHYLIHRFRMLLSAGIPLTADGRTQFLIADEIHLNFGERVVFNTFEQNRLTVGFKHKISSQWTVDTGYMMVYQQRPTGLDYNLNHTFRLFFYGNFDFRKDKSKELDYVRHAEE